ncbi:hypothetical protein [Amycolatopsis sp. lyj-23]|uniref:hypothetical protein n=1 Tax=Amycolatopsis sp. lyj-23 TaxID=2789283 RepID=UPI00397CF88E
MAERLFTIPLTSDLDGFEHEVTDEVVQANLRTDGQFRAVCGINVRVVSLLEPSGRPCAACRRIVVAARRAAAASTATDVVIPEQSRGRHRRRGFSLLQGSRR